MLTSLRRTYRSIPEKELRRRARKGDKTAQQLFRAVSYGSSLYVILWVFIGVSAALFFWLVNRSTPAWFALTASATVVWLGFVWIPSGEMTRMGQWFAVRMSPVIAWILSSAHPLLNRVSARVKRYRSLRIHTGLYEHDDIVELLKHQAAQPDNRIQQTELDIALHALTFGEQIVRDSLVPRRSVVTVNADDAVGPILMAELHKSGHSRFPVYMESPDKIIGILYMRDIVRAKQQGTVHTVMKKEVCYVHEEQSLVEALQVVLKTRHHLLVVVNSFEEYVGIITAEDILEHIIGRPIMDEFDQYEDIRAVATLSARREHKAHASVTPVQSDETVVESEES